MELNENVMQPYIVSILKNAYSLYEEVYDLDFFLDDYIDFDFELNQEMTAEDIKKFTIDQYHALLDTYKVLQKTESIDLFTIQSLKVSIISLREDLKNL